MSPDEPHAPREPRPEQAALERAPLEEAPLERPMLPHAWLAAAENADIARELDAIERMITDQIEARGPACWMSGRCCNFARFDHRLYVTGLEVARTVLRLDPRAPALSRVALDDALARGGCPFQLENRCGQHLARPTGCRVFFCDRSAQDWQHGLAERAHDMVKALHERRGIPYHYAEWRATLALFVDAGATPASAPLQA